MLWQVARSPHHTLAQANSIKFGTVKAMQLPVSSGYRKGIVVCPMCPFAREWHGWVGSVITLSMACRVFIPQAWQVISFRGGLCTFRISQSLCKCRANT